MATKEGDFTKKCSLQACWLCIGIACHTTTLGDGLSTEVDWHAQTGE